MAGVYSGTELLTSWLGSKKENRVTVLLEGMHPVICRSPSIPHLLKVPVLSNSTNSLTKSFTAGSLRIIKTQTVATCYFFVFVDDISEEKRVKESSLFYRDV
jgi:hypothetical protein